MRNRERALSAFALALAVAGVRGDAAAQGLTLPRGARSLPDAQGLSPPPTARRPLAPSITDPVRPEPWEGHPGIGGAKPKKPVASPFLVDPEDLATKVPRMVGPAESHGVPSSSNDAWSTPDALNVEERKRRLTAVIEITAVGSANRAQRCTGTLAEVGGQPLLVTAAHCLHTVSRSPPDCTTDCAQWVGSRVSYVRVLGRRVPLTAANTAIAPAFERCTRPEGAEDGQRSAYGECVVRLRAPDVAVVALCDVRPLVTWKLRYGLAVFTDRFVAIGRGPVVYTSPEREPSEPPMAPAGLFTPSIPRLLESDAGPSPLPAVFPATSSATDTVVGDSGGPAIMEKTAVDLEKGAMPEVFAVASARAYDGKTTYWSTLDALRSRLENGGAARMCRPADGD